MIATIARKLNPVLETPIIRRVRRNHALEHATVHMLSRRVPNLKIAGRSTDGGFVLIGDVPLEMVREAAEEALQRMKEGQSRLAVHPNCGTNLVTAGFFTTFAALVGLGRKRPVTADSISQTLTLMIFAVWAAQPVGMSLQKHITTKGDPGDLEIIDIERKELPLPGSSVRKLVIHRVNTRKG